MISNVIKSKNDIPAFAGMSGFTLIEVLIVIVIISIVSGVATLTIHFNHNKQLETFAHTLSNQIILAEEEAILRPAVLGLGFSANTVQFYQYKEKDHTWQPLNNKLFNAKNIPEKTEITLKIDNKTTPADGKPKIIISSSGDIPAFVISIGNPGDKPLYQVIGEANGNVYAK